MLQRDRRGLDVGGSVQRLSIANSRSILDGPGVLIRFIYFVEVPPPLARTCQSVTFLALEA